MKKCTEHQNVGSWCHFEDVTYLYTSCAPWNGHPMNRYCRTICLIEIHYLELCYDYKAI